MILLLLSLLHRVNLYFLRAYFISFIADHNFYFLVFDMFFFFYLLLLYICMFAFPHFLRFPNFPLLKIDYF